jgi:uncharacterized protein (UPF0335 family)
LDNDRCAAIKEFLEQKERLPAGDKRVAAEILIQMLTLSERGFPATFGRAIIRAMKLDEAELKPVVRQLLGWDKPAIVIAP